MFKLIFIIILLGHVIGAIAAGLHFKGLPKNIALRK